MVRGIALSFLAATALTALSVCLLSAEEHRRERPTGPPIPGLTAPDTMPNGCVDCHKTFPDRNKDERLTTELEKWSRGVHGHLLELAQAAVPEGVTLKGKHPDVKALIKVIPDDCLMCHRAGGKNVPAFETLIHGIHLAGRENHFVTRAGGHCTHCHKLDKKTGKLSLGSGKEEQTLGKAE